MASHYKLTYLDCMGLGEAIRFLLHYGKLQFEDVRISYADWPALKPSTPFGQIPIITIDDGITVNQNKAICRYIGKKLQLIGKDDLEDLQIDAIVETIDDLRSNLYIYHYHPDPEKKKEFGETLFSKTVPFMLNRLDAVVKNNNGYLAVGKLTWADIYFIGILGYFDAMAKRDLVASGDYPNLKKLKENILSIPQIKTYVENRPKTEI